ncbi:MAG: K(+)-transporting ATPase subunit C [Desertifilum sp. SIO1I2]|nr:K(+)-transporting ATPase subunit C [Desertifilum sp. SIO1I2]
MREFLIGLKATLVFWILTALIYPFIIIGLGFLLPYQANGSLIQNDQGQIIGSALIGQTFQADNYFWSRPSAIAYSETAAAAPTGLSGASNLAPSNPALIERVQADIQRLEAAQVQPTADLISTSGSGLDPHISPDAAIGQINRISQARNLPPNQLASLIEEYTEGRFLGIFGEPGVNVLRLNLALDRLR